MMGVSGSGKSLIGQKLANKIGGQFADADDFHAPETREKMRSGIPLTDEDRWPWLQRLRQHILAKRAETRCLVLACSALKAIYRDKLRGGDTGGELAFVHLHGSAELIRQRMAARQGHYMPVALLDSQLATLEVPTDALRVDVAAEPDTLVENILQQLSVV
jgi:gluconokinase